MVTLTRPQRGERGFTLLELLIVVTIIGILAGLAIVQVRHAQRKAAENVFRGNLALMRKAINDFYADRQRYPSSLQELVDEKYMHKVPPDPITRTAESWIEVREEPTDALDGSSSFGADPSAGPGIVDVQSGAEGETLEGEPYAEL